ncbi:unnamed protein product [Didymodactylos carnosus]|uniref:Uncharacterized protein n=1 Tax=Didymodactylos carnosus TaxID=1234261 RepID=A0A815AK97_9BILA|nr:unnamed protein product [Didymodactylos carnosus]CAF1265401.1 unnamed protein product [Didymodactylos carnosus]CAF4033735.1 unnamed protein product [Didymodactylos carnosus]CAF4071599.1 unnamed protein product [Didymodactylos carnosus]
MVKFKVNFLRKAKTFENFVKTVEKEAIKAEAVKWRNYPGVNRELHSKVLKFVQEDLQTGELSRHYPDKSHSSFQYRLQRDDEDNVQLRVTIPSEEGTLKDLIVLPRRDEIRKILETAMARVYTHGKMESDIQCYYGVREKYFISRNRVQAIMNIVGNPEQWFEAIVAPDSDEENEDTKKSYEAEEADQRKQLKNGRKEAERQLTATVKVKKRGRPIKKTASTSEQQSTSENEHRWKKTSTKRKTSVATPKKQQAEDDEQPLDDLTNERGDKGEDESSPVKQTRRTRRGAATANSLAKRN